MSFTDDIKRELLNTEVPDRFRDAFVYGFLYGIKETSRFVTSSREAVSCAKKFLPRASLHIETNTSRKRESYILTVTSKVRLSRYSVRLTIDSVTT